MNKIRREKGFLQIDETNYIRKRFCTKNLDGMYSYEWIEIAGERFLFKKGTIKECIQEVFWSHVLNALNIENVQYDLAFHDDYYGVITKDYNPNRYIVKSLYQIIREYEKIIFLETGERPLRDLFNIQDLKKVYECLFSKFGILCVDQLKKDTILKFIIQMLLGDSDCHTRNTEIWFHSNPTISPFYDLGRYGKLNLIYSIDDFRLKYINEIDNEEDKQDRIFLSFIRYASVQELEMLKEYMNRIREINRKNLFEELESKFQNKISFDLKWKLSNRLLHNTKSAEKILKR